MIIIFVLLFLKVNNHNLLILLISIFSFCLATTVSFKWVLKHAETIKELKPIAYFYGLLLIIILVNIFTNSIYPDSIIEISAQNNIVLPTQIEMAVTITYYFALMLLGYYLMTWVVALIIPSSVLLILYTTSKISRYINKYINKSIMIGFMSILQLLVFYGFYLESLKIKII